MPAVLAAVPALPRWLLPAAVVAAAAAWWLRRRARAGDAGDREDLGPEILRERYFADFEPDPLFAVLEAVAGAKQAALGRLRPHDALDDRRGSAASLREALRRMDVAVDWSRVLTVRQLVAAVVPLRERDPRAHR